MDVRTELFTTMEKNKLYITTAVLFHGSFMHVSTNGWMQCAWMPLGASAKINVSSVNGGLKKKSHGYDLRKILLQ